MCSIACGMLGLPNPGMIVHLPCQPLDTCLGFTSAKSDKMSSFSNSALRTLSFYGNTNIQISPALLAGASTLPWLNHLIQDPWPLTAPQGTIHIFSFSYL